jgi:phage recombination protein Bet
MTTGSAAPPRTEGALALRGDQHEWTPVQLAALAQLGVEGASHGDLMVFLHHSQRTGLDPFVKQIYMIKRQGKWTIQTGIDGFRLVARRTGRYLGKVSTEWCGRDGVWRDVWLGGEGHPPFAARVAVKHADHQFNDVAVCLYHEFVGKNYDGDVNAMWRTKPAHMIAKCAEAAALRAAFPNDLSGMFTDDEMAAADNPRPPKLPNTVEGEIVPDRDWDAAIAEQVTIGATDPSAAHAGLRKLWDEARAALPNATALHNQISEVGRKFAPQRAAQETPPPPPKPATAGQKQKIGIAMGKAGVTDHRASHLVAARLAGYAGPLLSYDDLTREQAAAVLDAMAAWERTSVQTMIDEAAKLIPKDDDPVWAEIAAAEAAAKAAPKAAPEEQ